MQVMNPLVPPQLGSPGGAPAPVANAPFVADSTKHETARPVSGSREGERPRPHEERSHPDDGERRSNERGEIVDISV